MNFKNKKNQLSIKILFLILSFCFFGAGQAKAEVMPLEIINIKPSGTGSPAISANNRIFRAYPGITYSIPVGAIGGEFPYEFSLSNEPAGMTIDTDGVITWTNPQASASDITVRVTDSVDDFAEAVWSISVTSSGFIFVDSSAGSGGDGTFLSPYDSMQDILDLGSSALNSIVYFREGTYNIPRHNGIRETPGYYGVNIAQDGGRAHIYIAYPGDGEVIFQMGGSNAHWWETYTAVSSFSEAWFEGITIKDPVEWGIRHGSGADYTTFWKSRITGLTMTSTSGNSNWGGIYTVVEAGNSGEYFYIGDSEFDDSIDAHLLGSLYYQNKMLIERTTFENMVYTGLIGGYNAMLALKVYITNFTFRQNEVNVSAGCVAFGTPTNSGFFESDFTQEPCENLEFNFNLIAGDIYRLSSGDPNDHRPVNMVFNRNTFTGNIGFAYLDYPDYCSGPWIFENNVMQNSLSGLDFSHYSNAPDAVSCVTDTDNLKGTSGLVDANGLLTDDYSEYRGTHGWEIFDSSDTTPPSAPSGLSVS